MRWLGIAVVTVWVVMAPQAHAQQTLGELINDLPSDGTYKLECFQAGQKVISEANLTRIWRGTPIDGFFGTRDGRQIRITQSADLACIVTQTGTHRE